MSEQQPETVEPEVVEGQEAVPVDAPPEADQLEDTAAMVLGDVEDADASAQDALAVPSADEPDHDAEAVEAEAPAAEDGE